MLMFMMEEKRNYLKMDREKIDGYINHWLKEPSSNKIYVGWNEVEELQQAGWNIGSHGVNHLDLTIQDAHIVEEELVNSKREIETRSGQPCEYFAYTWGRFSPALQHAVKAAGYHCAASGLHGPVTSSSDPFALPRVDVRAEYELPDFQNLVEGYWDFLGLKQRLVCKLT